MTRGWQYAYVYLVTTYVHMCHILLVEHTHMRMHVHTHMQEDTDTFVYALCVWLLSVTSTRHKPLNQEYTCKHILVCRRHLATQC